MRAYLSDASDFYLGLREKRAMLPGVQPAAPGGAAAQPLAMKPTAQLRMPSAGQGIGGGAATMSPAKMPKMASEAPSFASVALPALGAAGGLLGEEIHTRRSAPASLKAKLKAQHGKEGYAELVKSKTYKRALPELLQVHRQELRGMRHWLRRPQGAAAAATTSTLLGLAGVASVRRKLKEKRAAAPMPLWKPALVGALGGAMTYSTTAARAAKPQGPHGVSRGEVTALKAIHNQMIDEQVQGETSRRDLRSREHLAKRLQAAVWARENPRNAAALGAGVGAGAGAGIGALSAFTGRKALRILRNVPK
tara:strand:+ start:739 stop:1662 length:924 start_codon:yes stop_codon:yes gene_type:complete